MHVLGINIHTNWAMVYLKYYWVSREVVGCSIWKIAFNKDSKFFLSGKKKQSFGESH